MMSNNIMEYYPRVILLSLFLLVFIWLSPLFKFPTFAKPSQLEVNSDVIHTTIPLALDHIRLSQKNSHVFVTQIFLTNRYKCKKVGNKIVTIVYTRSGSIVLIEWKSKFFGPNWPPLKRCKIVSKRFHLFSRESLLRFISTGVMNKYNVICISNKAGKCHKKGLLITLEHEDDPEKILTKLFNLRNTLVR